MSENAKKPSFSSRVAYQNQREAVAWLDKAFGFETTVLATDRNNNVVHAGMRFGSGIIHVGSE